MSYIKSFFSYPNDVKLKAIRDVSLYYQLKEENTIENDPERSRFIGLIQASLTLDYFNMRRYFLYHGFQDYKTFKNFLDFCDFALIFDQKEIDPILLFKRHLKDTFYQFMPLNIIDAFYIYNPDIFLKSKYAHLSKPFVKYIYDHLVSEYTNDSTKNIDHLPHLHLLSKNNLIGPLFNDIPPQGVLKLLRRLNHRHEVILLSWQAKDNRLLKKSNFLKSLSLTKKNLKRVWI